MQYMQYIQYILIQTNTCDTSQYNHFINTDTIHQYIYEYILIHAQYIPMQEYKPIRKIASEYKQTCIVFVLGLQYNFEISIQTIQTWRSCDVLIGLFSVSPWSAVIEITVLEFQSPSRSCTVYNFSFMDEIMLGERQKSQYIL